MLLQQGKEGGKMQFEQQRLVSCEVCSTRVNVKDMKFDMTGTSLICQECYERQASRSTRFMEQKNLGESAAIERRLERAKNTINYIFYKCEGCQYSFSRKVDFKFNNCPNCGCQSVKIMQKNSAQQIVDTSDQDLDLGIDFI